MGKIAFLKEITTFSSKLKIIAEETLGLNPESKMNLTLLLVILFVCHANSNVVKERKDVCPPEKDAWCSTYVDVVPDICSNDWFINENGRYCCQKSCGMCDE